MRTRSESKMIDSGSHFTRRNPSVPLPSLPVETLENILTHAFPRQEPLTPFSWHYPHDEMMHLLLVSKAFRELCLPLVLHTVIVARPEALAILFHSETGLLVAGQEGRRNWGYVRELCVVDKIAFPLDPDYADDTDGLVPLTVPDHRGLDELCFLKPIELDLDGMDNASYARYQERMRLHIRRTKWLKANREQVIHADLRRRHTFDLKFRPQSTPVDFKDFLSSQWTSLHRQDLVYYAREEDDRVRDEFLRTVLLNATPRLIRQRHWSQWSLPQRIRHSHSADWSDYDGTTTLVIHDERGKEDLYSLRLYPDWIEVKQVHLVGFDLKRNKDIVREIEDEVATEEEGRRWTLQGRVGTVTTYGGVGEAD